MTAQWIAGGRGLLDPWIDDRDSLRQWGAWLGRFLEEHARARSAEVAE